MPLVSRCETAATRAVFVGGAAWSGAVYAARMRVTVDPELCQGHNRCYALAPEVFDVDEYGNAMVRGDGTVPPELEEKARLAIGNCPEYAISIVEGTA